MFRFDFGVLNEMTRLVAWRVRTVDETREFVDHEPDKDRPQVGHHPATVVGHRRNTHNVAASRRR